MDKRSDEDIRREVQQRLREIEVLREEARDQQLKFTALTEEQLTRKASGESAHSPYIYAQGWTSGTTPGSTATYSVYVSNPDPAGYYPLFVTIFFGMANFLGDGELGLGPSARHPKWPYLSSAAFGLAAGATATKSFSYRTPSQIPLGTYTGNAVLWRGDYHDRGAYLDRGLFEVTLT